MFIGSPGEISFPETQHSDLHLLECAGSSRPALQHSQQAANTAQGEMETNLQGAEHCNS